MTLLAPTLQAFFSDRMVNQKNASPRTIAAYRDAMRLLLQFASKRTGKPPSRLDIEDLDAPLISSFLNHLEQERGNSPRTRNARLAAIHSLYRYSALRHPEHAHTIARVLEIPNKRYDRTIVSYLEQSEIKALLAAPDRTTWLGRRDHALLLTAIQTGVRVSELVSLNIEHVRLDTGGSVKVLGKRRKQRVTPLTPDTTMVLRAWLTERRGQSTDPVFPTRQGRPLTPKAVAWLLDKHTSTAAVTCSSLKGKRVTPHTLRHTNAMLLLANNDIATVALWLGHESTRSTEIYIHADDQVKQKAIETVAPVGTPPGRYRPPDKLLAFLQAL
jgi:integrase/recombinase XerD